VDDVEKADEHCFDLGLLTSMVSSVWGFNVRNSVSHPHKITHKIVNLYVRIFTFLESRREEKIF
jgi:hypothetical protein